MSRNSLVGNIIDVLAVAGLGDFCGGFECVVFVFVSLVFVEIFLG